MSNINNVQDLVIQSYTNAEEWSASANSAFAVPVGVLKALNTDRGTDKSAIDTLIETLKNGVDESFDTFQEIINEFNATDGDLSDLIDDHDGDQQEKINIILDFQRDDINNPDSLASIESELIAGQIGLRGSEVTSALTILDTDVNAAVTDFTIVADAKISDFNNAVFGDPDNIDADGIVTHKGFDSFTDDEGVTRNAATGGKIYKVFNLTNHTVSIESESGDLVFKAVDKIGGNQSDMLRLVQTS